MPPPIRYARSGDVTLAYQVLGEGPLDLVFAPPWIGNIELFWEEPSSVRFIERLAAFSRLLLFDKRGTGGSDRVAPATPAEQVDDLSAAMEAAGMERAALFGDSEGGSQCALFAATYPERTSALVLFGPLATAFWSPETPWGMSPEIVDQICAEMPGEWGQPMGIELFAPSVAADERYRRWWSRSLRLAASPSTAVAYLRMVQRVDIRPILETIRVPTLVIQRSDDLVCPPEGSRYLAAHIQGARYVELPGPDHFPWVGDVEAVVSEIQHFLTGVRPVPRPDRVLATVLFTDIVDSTKHAADLGDRQWRELLAGHDMATRRAVERYRGTAVKTTGDGFLATFDGPARAIRCALDLAEEMRGLGLEIRAGLHTGECELIGADVGGIAVHIGARVAALAGAGEVLVSGTVKDLVAGSGIEFGERGEHDLKGVPGSWRLYAVDRVG
ncbi:MAG TPA: adenylate/guanylate cyclase domain-containing protein [Candidatus Acidoferrales bacterium]|nr:adenylate/guanylate cyclase domain-containing protein [Candidatus Acidoferrales bacterium]